MIRRLMIVALAATPLLAMVGCRHRCCRNNTANAPSPYLPPPPGGSFLTPPAGASSIPPTQIPTTPAGPTFLPPVGPGGSNTIPPPDFTAPSRNYGPPPTTTKPAGPDVLLPDPLPTGTSTRSLYPGTNTAKTTAPFLRPTAEPKRAPAPKTPVVGLPGFTTVKEGIATGRRPGFEGLDSLKLNGYRTLVYLHGSGEDVSSLRELAEKRGFKFIAIELTPETLPDALGEVNKLVSAGDTKPMYVFDDTGMRTGALWYLHFRSVDAMNGDAARIRARSIGLSDQTEEGRAFWVAINAYLAR